MIQRGAGTPEDKGPTHINCSASPPQALTKNHCPGPRQTGHFLLDDGWTSELLSLHSLTVKMQTQAELLGSVVRALPDAREPSGRYFQSGLHSGASGGKELRLSEPRFTNKFSLSKRVKGRLSNERVQSTCLLLCALSQFMYLLLHSLTHLENVNGARSMHQAACWREWENKDSGIATGMEFASSYVEIKQSLSSQGLKTCA